METANAASTQEQDLSTVTQYKMLDALEEGDYPEVELTGASDGTNEFGNYNYFYVKILKDGIRTTAAPAAAKAGSERRIAIRRGSEAKDRQLVALLEVLSEGLEAGERSSFLAGVKQGKANGKTFGVKFEKVKTKSGYKANSFSFKAAI